MILNGIPDQGGVGSQVVCWEKGGGDVEKITTLLGGSAFAGGGNERGNPKARGGYQPTGPCEGPRGAEKFREKERENTSNRQRGGR